ncbi:hypothetical protein M407DRAFT_243180 [Tulasnella calospora MUT 4182]|uniref:Uncharacterized protein n=1 Tax=Tulasnella calospora MUT 4182 TaxID=1051891 RepID=A0A0C3QKQ9_9AGAM|nr:hypothetical protein M407DRAFT_243180 [Tulasnella calospora MUT 4182]
MVKYLGRAVGYVKSCAGHLSSSLGTAGASASRDWTYLTSKKVILAFDTKTATVYSRKGHQKGTCLTKHRQLQTGDPPKCYF